MRTLHVNGSTRSIGDVQRFHTWPTVTPQNLGHHTWNVLRLRIELWGPPSPEETVYIVYHDGGELLAGDVSHQAKAADPELKACMNRAEEAGLASLGITMPSITSRQWWRFKACDLLECVEFAIWEIERGNRLMVPVVHNISWALYHHLSQPSLSLSGDGDVATVVARIYDMNTRSREAGGWAPEITLDGVDRR